MNPVEQAIAQNFDSNVGARIGVATVLERKKQGWVTPMAAIKGRRHRTYGAGAQMVQIIARISPAARDQGQATAGALGISFAAYLDQVLLREASQVDEHGRPVWWTEPVPADQAELPLRTEESPLKTA